MSEETRVPAGLVCERCREAFVSRGRFSLVEGSWSAIDWKRIRTGIGIGEDRYRTLEVDVFTCPRCGRVELYH